MSNSEKCLFYNIEIIRSGLAIDTFGNAGFKKDGKLFIKPSGVDLKDIDSSDISVVDIKTRRHIGGLKPSSDKWKLIVRTCRYIMKTKMN